MALRIELSACINCGLCRRACPTDAVRFFTTHRRTHVIDAANCIDCDLCVRVCPENCIVPDHVYVHDPAELEAAKARARAWAARRNVALRRLRERAATAIAKVGAQA